MLTKIAFKIMSLLNLSDDVKNSIFNFFIFYLIFLFLKEPKSYAYQRNL